ncbi:MAG: hypothetical protein QW279_01885 [Candidatus Jordarchaeaceae archaeon]
MEKAIVTHKINSNILTTSDAISPNIVNSSPTKWSAEKFKS